MYFVKAGEDGHSAFAVTAQEHYANEERCREAGWC
jgi:cell division protein YceG involved in septum cleavage